MTPLAWPVVTALAFGCTPLLPVVPAPLSADAPEAAATDRQAAQALQRGSSDYTQRWYCFENLKIDDDSGCATSLVACKNLAKIRGDEYMRFGVPFAASECEPFPEPICYHFRDSDTKYTRYMCHKTESSCKRSFEMMELEAISDCQAESGSTALGQTASSGRGDRAKTN